MERGDCSRRVFPHTAKTLLLTMFILHRYIATTVLRGFVLLALLMTALFSTILLIDELDQIGTGHYDWWLAVKYVLYHAPKLLLDFAAFISLVGSVIALGSLASHHELVATESLGVSPRNVIHSVLLTALLLMVIVLLNAQYVIPFTLQKAYVEKTLAIEGKGEFISEAGFWAQSNHQFIHIKDVKNGRIPVDVEIFEFNSQYQLGRYIHAKMAVDTNSELWQLQDVTQKSVQDGRMLVTHHDALRWHSFLSDVQLGVIVSSPDALSLTNLFKFIKGLKERGEQSYRYELLFWQKVVTPLSAAIMIVIAAPFVFGSQRHTTTGKRITLGILAGITFYVVTQVISHLGAHLQWAPSLIAVLPAMLVVSLLLFAYWYKATLQKE